MLHDPANMAWGVPLCKLGTMSHLPYVDIHTQTIISKENVWGGGGGGQIQFCGPLLSSSTVTTVRPLSPSFVPGDIGGW